MKGREAELGKSGDVGVGKGKSGERYRSLSVGKI